MFDLIRGIVVSSGMILIGIYFFLVANGNIKFGEELLKKKYKNNTDLLNKQMQKYKILSVILVIMGIYFLIEMYFVGY